MGIRALRWHSIRWHMNGRRRTARYASSVVLAASCALVASGVIGPCSTSGSPLLPPASATEQAPAGTARVANWQWPLDGPRTVPTVFVAPPTPYGRGHRGVDMRFSDAVVHAPDDGVVTFVGQVAGRGVITIGYSNGLKSSIEPVTSTLHAGDRVSRGMEIARAERGHATCPECVHFGVRRGDVYINPMLCFEAVPWSVLKPL